MPGEKIAQKEKNSGRKKNGFVFFVTAIQNTAHSVRYRFAISEKHQDC
jgi:hypothetical protein